MKRWSELDPSEPDAHVGELFRAVATPEPLSERELGDVRRRLALARPPSPARKRLRELSLVVVMMLAGSTFALAAIGVGDWWTARSNAPATVPSVAPPSISSVAPRKTQARTSPETPPALEEPVIEEPVVAPAPRASSPPRSSADAKALAAETEVMERVLLKLRKERDPRGALALLDQSQALFTHGSLGLEAQVARIDALLALSRNAEALALLERVPFAQVGRGGELRLVRAELRAASDCGRALADFDVLVKQPLSAPLAERALYGRAACELGVGDREQGKRDLNQYLARFPHGRFAADVAARLDRLQGP